MHEIKYPFSIVNTLYELNIKIFPHKYLTCIAQFMVENFELCNEENMDSDNKWMPTRNNQHTDIHYIILNRKCEIKFSPTINAEWKVTMQNQWWDGCRILWILFKLVKINLLFTLTNRALISILKFIWHRTISRFYAHHISSYQSRNPKNNC